MVHKDQNEISPTIYNGIGTKTNEKDLKIPDLQALTLGRVKKITLYLISPLGQNFNVNLDHLKKQLRKQPNKSLCPLIVGQSVNQIYHTVNRLQSFLTN